MKKKCLLTVREAQRGFRGLEMLQYPREWGLLCWPGQGLPWLQAAAASTASPERGLGAPRNGAESPEESTLRARDTTAKLKEGNTQIQTDRLMLEPTGHLLAAWETSMWLTHCGPETICVLTQDYIHRLNCLLADAIRKHSLTFGIYSGCSPNETSKWKQ